MFEEETKKGKSSPTPSVFIDKVLDYSMELRVLLVGDHSLYEKFTELQRGDEFAAYHSIRLYLNATFQQVFDF